MGLQLKSTRNKQASREREKRAAFYLKLWHDYKTATKIRKGVYKKTRVDFFLRFVPLKNIITKWFRLVLKLIKLVCEVKQLKSTTTVEKEPALWVHVVSHIGKLPKLYSGG